MIDSFLALITSTWQRLRTHTLVMNAFYLMLSTFIVAAAGFVFWIFIARAYDPSIVGVATALLSTSSLLSLLGLIGFDATFIRFLPRATNKNEHLNSGFIIVTLVGGGLAACVAFALLHLAPEFSLLANPWTFIGFVFFTVVGSLYALTTAIFVGLKKARFILNVTLVLCVVKIALPLIVVNGDAMTIFVLAGSAQTVGLILSMTVLARKLNYTFMPRLHKDTLRLVRKFSSTVYVSSILNLLPPTLLPLLIVHYMEPQNAAYYYIAFTIATALYTFAYASMQSVFAEGSHDETALRSHVIKAAKFVAILLVPSALLTILLSNFILSLFGQNYARESGPLLHLFAYSAIPVAIYSALGAIFKVKKNLQGIISMNLVYGVTILMVSYVALPKIGLIAVGIAWLIGNVAACITGALFLFKINNKYQEE